MTYADLTLRLKTARSRIDRQVGEARHIAATGKQVQMTIDTLTAREDLYERAAAVLASISDDRQAAAQQQIETLVTQGLQTIFGSDLSFHLVAGTRAKTPVVDLIVRSRYGDTTVDTPVLDARGGGLAAVVGFLLRLVVLLLTHDKQDTVLILDETFAHLSADYEPRLAAFIRDLVDSTGVQVIMVTHSDAYAELADTRYRFTLRDGATHVTAI